MIDNNSKESNDIQINYYFIIILVIIALVVAYFLLFQNLFKNRYIKIEETMVSKAKNYVINNNITTDKEIYLDVSNLNIDIDSDCYLTSGVLFDGNNYVPNLICDKYQSKIIKTNDNLKDFIKLNGDEVIVLAKGMNYDEPGYECNDIVKIQGNVGKEEGVYNLYYQTTNSNSIARRKVIIIDNPKINNLFPNISLIGDSIVYLKVHDQYKELGVNTSDTIEGDKLNYQTIGVVNSDKVGEYLIDYITTNSRGYKNNITRIVKVIDTNDLVVDYTLFPKSLTNKEVKITLSVSDEYNRIVYPDGTVGNKLDYTVSENGEYEFTIYDKHNKAINKKIIISNIDKDLPYGDCIATTYYNRTEIKVINTDDKDISSYEYYVNSGLLGNTKSLTYVSNITNPSLVKVIIKDSVNNQNELTCSLEENAERQLVTDTNGKNCLEGFTCYVQFDYDSSKYPYCSKSNNPSSCGGIGRDGASITAVANVLAMMGVRSKGGAIYTPYTVWEELYAIDKKSGQCNGGCAEWGKIREAIVNANLTAPRTVFQLTDNNLNQIIEHLRNGYPVIVKAEGKPFANGNSNYLTLIGINEAGNIFISDSTNKTGIIKENIADTPYYVDTWISPNDLITGNVKEFLLIGPIGMFEGK